jgi:hypothetical protein
LGRTYFTPARDPPRPPPPPATLLKNHFKNQPQPVLTSRAASAYLQARPGPSGVPFRLSWKGILVSADILPLPPSCTDTLPRPSTTVGTFLPPVLVAVAALALAGLSYGRFLDDPRHLWTSAEHDRNAHYLFALNVALDLRGGSVIGLLHDIDGARVWGPLHGLIAGILLAVGGLDYRLALLPSLAAWVAAAVLVFLIARRAVRAGGNLAGFAAAAFFLASPAYRAFSTDIMLEGPGACLTLLVLYLYVVTVQSHTVRAARALGLALTALFLLKYNYWLLALIPLAVVEAASRGRAGWQALRQTMAAVPWRSWLWAQLRHPLNYVLAVVIGLAVFVHLQQPLQVELGGRTFWLRSADNFIHIAYVVLFLRALPWWWRQGRAWVRGLSFPLPQLLAWHGLPVALWFLMPKRPSYFFWYLTRNHGGEVPQHDMLAAASFYWNCLIEDYHLGLASVLVAVALLAVALLCWRRLRPGGMVILAFVVLAAFLAVRYPSHRSRFLHSWLATGWVAAGIGLAQLTYGRLSAALGAARPWLAGLATAGIVLAHTPGALQPGHAPEGGPRPQVPSNLDVTDSYLPDLADARRPVVLSNAPIKQLTAWTYLERFGRKAPIEIALRRLPPDQSFDQGFEEWLHKTRSDWIVFIEAPPGTLLFEEPRRPGYDRIPSLLAGQSLFHLKERQDFPQFGCTVTLWQRREVLFTPRGEVRPGCARPGRCPRR